MFHDQDPSELAQGSFDIALAGVPRHTNVSELSDDLARYKQKGYTGIWIENDCLNEGLIDGSSDFPGNWRLFNIFDFTFGEERNRYRDYLHRLCDMCQQSGLEVYMSFWMPMLNPELLGYLQKNIPRAIGKTDSFTEKNVACICTCNEGAGLQFIASMVKNFLQRFPQVRGIKVATEDNHALNCDTSCTNSHGTTRAQHAANLFFTVQQAVRRVSNETRFLLYPWFWRAGYTEEILPRLSDDYFVVTKMEVGSTQNLGTIGGGDLLFDSSIVSEEPGAPFLDWIRRVGPERIIDMVATGTGIDDFFLSNPPYPGRLYRRFKRLLRHGVRKFLDFECGGHCAGSLEETVRLFKHNPKLNEDEFLESLAASMYAHPTARRLAVEGWKSFDTGFASLPIGLAETGSKIFSGRFGFAWSMCIATPLVRSMFGPERGHEIHWFSPYNFFHGTLAHRLEIAFKRVLSNWNNSAKCLSMADALEGGSVFSSREAAAAQAHVLSVLSVLNWCSAATLVYECHGDREYFGYIVSRETELTEQFVALLEEHPWLWANNCWHPHRTPLSQKGIGFTADGDPNVFQAKLLLMRQALEVIRFAGSSAESAANYAPAEVELTPNAP